MESTVKGAERNNEIVTFFYLIFGHRIHQGMEQDAARKEAYDAVSLRYGISKGTLFNIISAVKTSRKVNETAFRENIITLISDLTSANEELLRNMERNDHLITLLNECLENDAR